jgi:phosphate:Na+ symporter
MNFGFFSVIQIIGSLAFFIYGMKMMSDGIQRAAGAQLRNILRQMTKNRYLGVLTGFLITALVQSSSATTVMTVSFVNAGLLSLVESAGVMMGANIGTTITAWIISILGFKVKLSAYSYPLFAIGIPLILAKSGKLKYWGEFIVGFAILFLGLSALKGSMPDLEGNSQILSWIKDVNNYGIFSRILFVFIGAMVTVLVQSSSAAMAITLTLVYTGWLPLDVAAAMVLGENIGTTITAELASLVGNANAKRSARIHSMFNIIGVIWMVISLPWIIEYISIFVDNYTNIFEGHVEVDASIDTVNRLKTYKLAAFHTVFNLLNVVFLLPFVPWLVKVATWSVKDKDSDDDHSLKFISTSSLTPELATVELQKEAGHFGEIASSMSGFFKELINTTNDKKIKKMLKKIKKYEKITDRMEIEITEYVTKLSNKEITPDTSANLRGILHITNDLERIGDLYFQMSKIIENKIESKIYFLPEQRSSINEMIEAVEEAFVIMTNNLNTSNYGNIDKTNALDAEKKINKIRHKLRKENIAKLGSKEYNVNAAMVYNNLFSLLERVGDHIVNITEAAVGEI